jgi:hypothetical protein
LGGSIAKYSNEGDSDDNDFISSALSSLGGSSGSSGAAKRTRESATFLEEGPLPRNLMKVVVVVEESKVAQLQDMGFEESMAREALRSNDNDIDAAANHIISLMYA